MKQKMKDKRKREEMGKFRVNEDFSPEVRDMKRKLLEHIQRLREEKAEARGHLKYNRLVFEGRTYMLTDADQLVPADEHTQDRGQANTIPGELCNEINVVDYNVEVLKYDLSLINFLLKYDIVILADTWSKLQMILDTCYQDTRASLFRAEEVVVMVTTMVEL